MRKPLIVSLLIVLLLSGYTRAQTPLLDSLRASIDNYPARDTHRVSLISGYIQVAVNENTTSLLPYVQEEISISKEFNYRRGLQAGYTSANIYFSNRGDYENALLYADSALESYKGDTSKRSLRNLAYLHHNLGGDCYSIGDYVQAINHFQQAAEILEKYEPKVLANVYSGLATIYDELKQAEKATEYYLKSIEMAEKYGDKNSITLRHLNYSSHLINQKKFAKVQSLLQKTEPLMKEVTSTYSLILFYQVRAGLAQEKKEYGKAITDYKKALEYARTNQDMYAQVNMLSPLAQCLTESGNMPEAKKYLDTLLSYSLQYKMRFGELKAYTLLANWYSNQGDYKTSNEYLYKQVNLSDSISTDEMKQKISMAETRFRVQVKDREIKALQTEKENQLLQIKQKNILNYILIGGVASLVIISLLTYRNYKIRQKIQQQRISELETEKQLLATQSLLKGQEDERNRLAKDLHDGLGGMLSGVKLQLGAMKGNLILNEELGRTFDNALVKLDESITEMRRVAHNMMPEALMKLGLQQALQDYCEGLSEGQSFTINTEFYGLEQRMDSAVEITVYRIVQELVNNTVKHSGATSILAQVIRQDDNLTITVEDNGKGFINLPNDSKSAGLRNIQSRVNYLRGTMDIQSSPGKATSVHIECTISNNG